MIKRLVKKLFKVALLAILVAAAGLVGGYRYEQGLWAWDDRDGFQEYAMDWGGWAKERSTELGEQARVVAIDLNEKYHLTDKSKQLMEKAKTFLAGAKDTPPVAVASETPPEAAPTNSLGLTQAQADKLPKGYLEAYEAGLEHHKTALMAFRDAMPGTPQAQAKLIEAQKAFEAAQDSLQKATDLYPSDQRAQQIMQDIQEYMHDVMKRRTVGSDSF